jgi:signal transduction histidine kinase
MSKPLLQKNTRYLLIWLPVVLLVCSLLFFVMLQMQANHMQEKQLLLKQNNVWNGFLEKSGSIQNHITGEYDITETSTAATTQINKARDTVVYYADKKSSLPFRIFTGRYEWNNNVYLLTTYVSSTEISHLIIKVFIAEALILALILIVIVSLNRKSSRFLWQPFFSTLKKVNDYDIIRNQSFALSAETGTTEFDELNKSITTLINNVNNAYHNQKQFVENASHEMQTPLAIIRSKLELLINQPDLTEKTALMLGDITEANERLSQMNRTLLLLTKIENKQFPDIETINIPQMIEQVVTNFTNHYPDVPAIETNIEENIIVHANRSLMEILISNLAKNAIVHNQAGGRIKITLSGTQLCIENTGLPIEINPEELFERFKKGSHQTKTTGLGLALVKQICNLYHYSANYQYSNGWHLVKINFA